MSIIIIAFNHSGNNLSLGYSYKVGDYLKGNVHSIILSCNHKCYKKEGCACIYFLILVFKTVRLTTHDGESVTPLIEVMVFSILRGICAFSASCQHICYY